MKEGAQPNVKPKEGGEMHKLQWNKKRVRNKNVNANSIERLPSCADDMMTMIR